MNTQTSTKQTKAQPDKKTVESIENICVMNLHHPAISSHAVFLRVAWTIHASRE